MKINSNGDILYILNLILISRSRSKTTFKMKKSFDFFLAFKLIWILNAIANLGLNFIFILQMALDLNLDLILIYNSKLNFDFIIDSDAEFVDQFQFRFGNLFDF